MDSWSIFIIWHHQTGIYHIEYISSFWYIDVDTSEASGYLGAKRGSGIQTTDFLKLRLIIGIFFNNRKASNMISKNSRGSSAFI